MRNMRMSILAMIVLAGMVALVGPATADRGGWADPPGGWDLVYEGRWYPLNDGWYNGGGSDDPVGYDANDVTSQVITGQGDTEDGVNPAADAIVLRVQDNSTGTDGTGRKIKFTKPFQGTYAGAQDQHLINVEGGVTICVRWRVLAGTYVVDSGRSPYTYAHYVLGIDGGAVTDGRCGIAIGAQHTQWSAGDNVRSTATLVGDLTQFHTMWIVMERANESSDPPNNYKGTLYVDGSLVLADVPMWGPGGIGADAIWGTADDAPADIWYDGRDASVEGPGEPEENRAVATFGPGRTGATITIDYDYMCFKKGVHLPTVAGPPDAPSVLQATAVAWHTVSLHWTDNSSNEDNFQIQRKEGAGGTYATIATLPAGTVMYNDIGLNGETTYFYQVRATNANGNSAWSNEASATTPASSLDARNWPLYD